MGNPVGKHFKCFKRNAQLCNSLHSLHTYYIAYSKYKYKYKYKYRYKYKGKYKYKYTNFRYATLCAPCLHKIVPQHGMSKYTYNETTSDKCKWCNYQVHLISIAKRCSYNSPAQRSQSQPIQSTYSSEARKTHDVIYF